MNNYLCICRPPWGYATPPLPPDWHLDDCPLGVVHKLVAMHALPWRVDTEYVADQSEDYIEDAVGTRVALDDIVFAINKLQEQH